MNTETDHTRIYRWHQDVLDFLNSCRRDLGSSKAQELEDRYFKLIDLPPPGCVISTNPERVVGWIVDRPYWGKNPTRQYERLVLK